MESWRSPEKGVLGTLYSWKGVVLLLGVETQPAERAFSETNYQLVCEDCVVAQ